MRFKKSLKVPNGHPEVVSERTNNIIADKKRTKHYIEKQNNTQTSIKIGGNSGPERTAIPASLMAYFMFVYF